MDPPEEDSSAEESSIMTDSSKKSQMDGYKYSSMSNLVLHADKRFTSIRRDEPSGDPESLAGKLNIMDMGSRVMRAPKVQKPKAAEDVERGDIRLGEEVLAREKRKRKRNGPASNPHAFYEVDVEDLVYKPRTAATREIYNLLVIAVRRRLGDVSAQMAISATDAVLESIKNDEMKDFDKKREIDDLIGQSISSKEYTDLVQLSNKLTDYGARDPAEDEADRARKALKREGQGGEEDEELAVELKGSDDEADGSDYAHSLHDDSSEVSDDEDGIPMKKRKVAADESDHEDDIRPSEEPEDDEEVVIGAGKPATTAGAKKLVPAHDIDAFWVQRHLAPIFDDDSVRQVRANDIMKLLSLQPEEGDDDFLREVQNSVMEALDYEDMELTTKIMANKDRIYWVSTWRRAEHDAKARKDVESRMVAAGHRDILDEITGRDNNKAKGRVERAAEDTPEPEDGADVEMTGTDEVLKIRQPRKVINLENLIFEQGNHLMTNPTVKLPPGSTKTKFKGYEEVKVPAPKSIGAKGGAKRMPTSELPDWAQAGFGSSKDLNPIQTACYESAFHDDGNMLVCAPTGSGKTNVAMLTMLREIGKHRDQTTGEIRADQFKMVYIAPLKALVHEQVGNFSARLKKYGLNVCEFTGDSQATKNMLHDSSLIVATPEKWDVVTRKATEVSYTNLVTLIIIDEIHLLHDDRGWVLESIVSRYLRREDHTGNHVRIVGLSATLPNYEDVGSFLRTDKKKSMFHFDSSYRPCPLAQEFCGITERKRIKQLKTMNDICYSKVLEQVGQKGNQMLIFTHSRKDTAMTAKYIRDRALEENTMDQVLRGDSAIREILRSESEAVADQGLREVMPYGFGIHHAGMSKADRVAVEELFADGNIQVLVCTATLAWGVNLPAHTVIIKGTSVYLPQKGGWGELSPQDVLQMLGRAGRPQYDTFGEGIIITTSGEMQYYMSLMNQQLPIESQFATRLTDSLNAEIVLGNIRNRDEAAEWLGYSYFFVRMLRSPGLYQVGAEYEDDTNLIQKRTDLVHSAAILLAKSELLRYDPKTGKFQATDLGRIASHYYLKYGTVKSINDQLIEDMDDIRFMRLFSSNDEFRYIPVRQDEKPEVAKLLEMVPIPVAENKDDPAAKVNCLLQCWISRIPLDGFTMTSDMVNISTSAARIFRAIFEICMHRGLAEATTKALDYCHITEHRNWTMFSPLSQFPKSGPPGTPTISEDIVNKADRIGVKWPIYLDLDPPRLSELLGMPRAGKQVYNAIQHFPRMKIDHVCKPISRSLLHLELTLTPNFKWNDTLHGSSLAFWVFIEDLDVPLLHHELFILRKEYVDPEPREHIIELTVPVIEPVAPHYFIHVESDRWFGTKERDCILIRDHMMLPEPFPAPTPLMDLQPLQLTSLERGDFQVLFKNIRFNKIQTQVFNSLFETDENVLVAAPVGAGKTFCAEFAILRHWTKGEQAGRAIYIAPYQELVDIQHADWSERLASVGGGKEIVKLTGDAQADLKLLASADLVLATPPQWDLLSRSWRNRKNVRSIGLLIADELHLIGGLNGPVYEAVMSRMQFMSNTFAKGLRLVGLSVPVAGAKDMGAWLGASKRNIYNFAPDTRPMPLELRIQSFNNPHFPSLMAAMARPIFHAITELSPDKPTMIFVSDPQQIRNSAIDLIVTCNANDRAGQFLNADLKELQPVLERITERHLAKTLSQGIAYFHEGLNDFDKRAAKYLFNSGAAQVMLVSHRCAYEINTTAHMVIIMGTQYFDGNEHRYIDYRLPQVLQMFGLAGRQGLDKIGKGVLMAPAMKREYYKKFMEEPLPVESHLNLSLADAFIPDIVGGSMTTTEEALNWFTYTYLYRRLLVNPSYYGVRDNSQDMVGNFLSDAVEDTMTELTEAKMIELDDEDIEAQDAARIAAYYNLSYITMQTFYMSLVGHTNMKTLLRVVTSASEFENIPIRKNEAEVLRKMYSRLPIKVEDPNFGDPNFKAYILLQAQFARLDMNPDLLEDQKYVITQSMKLLAACVDVLSSKGLLNVTLPMEMSQMTVQGMWDSDSQLLQLPHFSVEQASVAKDFGVRDINSFTSAMDPEEFKDSAKMIERLGLSNQQLLEISNFTNDKWPDFEMSHKVVDPESATTGEPVTMQVTIKRAVDEEDDEDMELDSAPADAMVHAPYYPGAKPEGWWLVVGHEAKGEVLATKRVAFGRSADVKVEFVPTRAGKLELTLYLVSDSYIGIDEAQRFKLVVAEGEAEEEEEEGEDGDAMDEDEE